MSCTVEPQCFSLARKAEKRRLVELTWTLQEVYLLPGPVQLCCPSALKGGKETVRGTLRTDRRLDASFTPALNLKCSGGEALFGGQYGAVTSVTSLPKT
ncbi:hypothetical protein HPB47_027291 [Ixodes persulcatus]|uniref:Uncharacterized protein n=1 Tax=Ixodes persulcatus TaxID=34615 RepID=A0AC60PW87_IXOPE|nr:hypothetical protein HPB47_027291 [Ixodes persulcatus]